MTKVVTYSGGGFAEVDVPALGGRGRALLNFGAGQSDAKVVISGQASIVAGSNPVAVILCEATPTHSADEHRIEQLDVRAGAVVPGVGFTIWGTTRNTALSGQFNVTWQWS